MYFVCCKCGRHTLEGRSQLLAAANLQINGKEMEVGAWHSTAWWAGSLHVKAHFCLGIIHKNSGQDLEGVLD